ncbi:uncharacterized protein ARMOST_16186 [Armillaria ostoyae]|uniref:DDE-1 domain-containing protein n=1 Tax=Armillaria ostoyae TaxID=47428 RepID=A0A284RVL7_ARMOS|nr:uncharacterized protein ARMOST_16186 [Armillaria ostoyae]
MARWGENNISDGLICVSSNGWTDSKLALEWLTKDFNATTCEKAAGWQCLLLLDGHNSHHSLMFLEYANENNIIIFGYPSHCTHALQDLNIVCFTKIKDKWKKVIHEFEQQYQHKVWKGNFTKLFGQANKSTFDPETIKAALQVTGMHLFNNKVITTQ